MCCRGLAWPGLSACLCLLPASLPAGEAVDGSRCALHGALVGTRAPGFAPRRRGILPSPALDEVDARRDVGWVTGDDGQMEVVGLPRTTVARRD